MKRHELHKKLKEFGFKLERVGKHELWSDGKSRITVPNHNKIEGRLSVLIRLQIKKAILNRERVTC